MHRPSIRFALSRAVVLALSLVLLVASQGSAASTWSRLLADWGSVTGAAPGPSSGLYAATFTYASGKYRARIYRLARDGSTVWTRQLSAAEYIDAGQVMGLVSDGSGVYVSYRVKSWPEPLQYQVRKYDPAGKLTWKAAWSGVVEGEGGLIGVAGGTVYVAYHDDLGHRDLIRRYATDTGDQKPTLELALDARLYQKTLSGFVATSGGLYLASPGALWDEDKIYLRKVALDGTTRWSSTISRTGDDLEVGTLSVDNSSLVLAYSVVSTDIIRLVRYSLGGTKRWTAKAPGTYTPTGATSGSAAYSATMHNTNTKSAQTIVARYSSSGAVTQRREVGTSGSDLVSQIVVSGGYLYLLGSTTTGGSDHRPLVMRVAAP